MKSEPQLLLSRQEIDAAIKKLATEIKRDYRGKCPLLIGVLKGSFVFMADLVRELDFPVQVEFVRVASYGESAKSSGKVRMVQGLRCAVKERNLLVIEDIVDTGLTIAFLLEHLKKKKPASLKLCVLASKPERRQVPVYIDYLGFTVPNKFLVGYGLDMDEKYRNLPDICSIEDGL